MVLWEQTNFLVKLQRFIVRVSPTILIVTVLFPGVAVYCWSASKERNKTDCRRFALISHLGSNPPASCSFTLFISLTSFWFYLVITKLHSIKLSQFASEQNKDCCHHMDIKWANDTALVLGYITSLGLLFVGSFQTSEMKHWHGIGLVMFVLPGILYMIIMATLSEKKLWLVRWLRVIVIFISVVFVFLFGGYLFQANHNWEPGTPLGRPDEDIRKTFWCREDGGFRQYTLAAIFEVTFVTMFLTFIGTLQPEFWNYKKRQDDNERQDDNARYDDNERQDGNENLLNVTKQSDLDATL